MSKSPQNRLVAPADYWELTEDQKKQIVNQCGPDGPLNSLVPNSLFGLDISDECDAHDWMFVQAKNSRELKEADDVFLMNMKSKVREGTTLLPLIWLRESLAHLYYAAVRLYSMAQSKPRGKSRLDK